MQVCLYTFCNCWCYLYCFYKEMSVLLLTTLWSLLPECFAMNNLMAAYKCKLSTMGFVLIGLALDGIYNSNSQVKIITALQYLIAMVLKESLKNSVPRRHSMECYTITSVMVMCCIIIYIML